MSPRTPAQCLVLDLQSAEARLRGLKDSERLSLLVRLLADSDPHHLRAELISSGLNEPLSSRMSR
jgi:hypothetical protein